MSESQRTFQLGASPTLVQLLVLVHALGGAGLIASAPPIWLGITGILVIGLHLAWSLSHHAHKSAGAAVVRLSFNHRRLCQWRTRAGKTHWGHVQRSSYAHPRLVIVRLRAIAPHRGPLRRVTSVLIATGTLAEEDFRDLRVRLGGL